MSKLSENLGRRFVITGEITPPRGPSPDRFITELEELKKLKLDALNVVDNPGAMLLLSSLAGSILVKQNGLEPIFQLTCRDRNVLALESDLLGAASFGIENVLAITGDHPKVKSSDHPNAKPVYDLDSTLLIQVIKGMNQGKDINGKELNKKTEFFIGSGMVPSIKPVEPEIHKTKVKLEAGAEFFQTQAIFDPSLMEAFLEKYESLIKEDERKRIIMGIVPIHSHELLLFLRQIPGIVIPSEVENRIKNAKNQLEEGVTIATELADSAKELGLGGIHIAPAGEMECLIKVVEGI